MFWPPCTGYPCEGRVLGATPVRRRNFPEGPLREMVSRYLPSGCMLGLGNSTRFMHVQPHHTVVSLQHWSTLKSRHTPAVRRAFAVRQPARGNQALRTRVCARFISKAHLECGPCHVIRIASMFWDEVPGCLSTKVWPSHQLFGDLIRLILIFIL